MSGAKPSIPTHILDRARSVAQHEMGHYVVARLMGIATDDVSIKIIGHNGHIGAATVFLAQGLSNLDAVTNYLKCRVLTLYAGAMAETLHPEHVPQTGVDNDRAVSIIRGALGAEQDHAKAREAIHLLRNIMHPETQDRDEIQRQLSAFDQRLWGRARELVEQFESTIVGVAGALTEKLETVGSGGTYVAALTDAVLREIPTIKGLPLLSP